MQSIFKIIFYFVVFNLNYYFSFSQNFDEYYGKAINSFDNEKFQEAIQFSSKAIQYKNEVSNNYKLADVYVLRAISKYNINQIEKAIDDLKEAQSIKPEYAKSSYLLAKVYAESKQLNLALSEINKAIHLKPDEISYLVLKCKILNRMSDFASEIELWTYIISIDANNDEAYRYRGSAYNMSKKYDEAINDLSKAISLKHNDIASYFDRGLCYAQLKKFDLALADINKGVEIDSTQAFVAYNNIAYFIKFEQEDWDGAIEYFSKAIELEPKFAYGYSNRAYAKYKKGLIKEAFKDIRKSLELDPSNSYAYKNYALFYIKENNIKDACTQLNKAKQLGYSVIYDSEVDDLLKQHCK